jgi:methylthioribulose-1-phosphate dehydratase
VFTESLASLGRDLHARGWLPATSGNLSVRLAPDRALVTVSGRHKGRLGPDDFLIVDLDARPQEPSKRPSAEALLHARLYAADPAIGAVLHVHAPFACVVSRAGSDVRLQGWELQKAFPGVESHDAALVVPVFPNDQDIPRLAAAVHARLPGFAVPGYLIAGHGLYAWGASLDDAYRHLEAFEALFHLVWLSR